MFTNPLQNIKAFDIRETDLVADLGAGTGFYAILAAKIADKGKVYAVEIAKDFIHTINSKIKEAHLKNIEAVWGDVEKLGGTKLKDGILDKVIASNILHQVSDKEKFLTETNRILKIGGEVLFIDWEKSPLVHNKLTIPKDKALKLFEEHGFSVVREISVGEHHYGIIFIKNK